MIFAFAAPYLYWLLLPIAALTVYRVVAVANEETGYRRALDVFAALTFGAYVLLVAFCFIFAINVLAAR